MRIVSIESFLVPPRWLLVKVSTAEGRCGWGEPVVREVEPLRTVHSGRSRWPRACNWRWPSRTS